MFTVLHIIERLTLGGASRALIGLSKYSRQYGNYRHRVISLLPAQPEAISIAADDGLELVEGSEKSLIDAEVRAADIVQIHWWNAPVLQRLMREGLPPSRLMVWCHVVGDTSPNIITPALIDHADVTIASNPYTHRETKVFQNLAPETWRKKTGMIVDPTDFDRVKDVRKRPHTGFNVGYIGTVGYYKMHRDFVEMSSAVSVPNVKFLVCGGGIQEQLRAEAVQRDTASKFEFLGYQENISEVISQLDVYGYPLCPDTYASGELNLQEVMYAGVTPVVFPYGGVRRLVLDQFSGLVVTTNEEYRQAIEYLYHHPEERLRMGENASVYARQMFGAERAGKALNSFFDRMLEDDKRRRFGLDPADLGESISVSSGLSYGGSLFAESLGSESNPFLTSLDPSNGNACLAADESIQAMSPVVHIAGIMEYRNQYPRDAWLCYWSSLVFFGQGLWGQALEGFKFALEMGIEHWRVHWFLALASRRLNRFEEAREALLRVRALQPEFAPAQELLTSETTGAADCPFPVVNGIDDMRPVGRGEESSTRIDKLSEDNALAVLSEASDALERGELDQLDQRLERIHGFRFSEAGSFERLGQIEFNRGRFSDAAETLKAGLLEGCDSVKVLTQLAACSFELEEIEEFESYLTQAMERDPCDPLPHKFLAHLNVGQGSYVDAAKGCRDILRVTPDDIETLRLLSICFEKTGEFDSQLATYDEILRLQPGEPEIQKARQALAERLVSNQVMPTHLEREQGGGSSPLVSAIVSTYNGESYIASCLDDLLGQSAIGLMEIIVVDSGSDENEGEIVARYQESHPRIHYIRTETRETLYAAWNRALEVAQGRYVFNANTDDSRHPKAVERFVEAMETHPDAALAYADCHWTDQPNDVFSKDEFLRKVRYPDYHPALSLFYCYTGCLQFWRTNELRDLGGFEGRFHAAGDYEVLMRLAKAQKKVVHVPEVLSLFYQNTSGLTQQSNRSAQEEGAARDVFRKELDVGALYVLPSEHSADVAKAWVALGCFAHHVRIPWHDHDIGDDAFALACFQKALLLDSECETAAGNLCFLLSQHGRPEIGRQFLMGKDVGWTETRWRRIEEGGLQWVDVELPLRGIVADRIEPTKASSSDLCSESLDEPVITLGRGVRWSAPFFNPSGYGSEALNFVAPLATSGALTITHNSTIVSQDFVSGMLPDDRRSLNQLVPGNKQSPPEISICHGPVSCFEVQPDARYHIGRTMFETDRLPKDWVRQCNLMDEIWVPTEFNRETFLRSGVEARKIVLIPGAVDENHFDPGQHEPAELPNRARFNFLSVFEWIWRKGWDVLLKAYLQEFGPEDDVCLYLRCYECNCPDGDAKKLMASRVLEVAQNLGVAEDQLPRIEILADQVPYGQLPSLYRSVQCLVAPSRGEGWGRPHHEAMMMGVPVIATNWSGNTEFMNEENSYLLDYELSPVRGVETAFQIYEGHEWAEPSAEHLRELMRRAYSSPDEAMRKGAMARTHVLKHFSRASVAQIVSERLKAIDQKLDGPEQRIPVLDRGSHCHDTEPAAGSSLLNWSGPYSDLGSLAQVNRFLTQGMHRILGKKLVSVEPTAFAVDGVSAVAKDGRSLVRQEKSNAAVIVRHQWPPNFEARKGDGALVVVQPWEFGALPISWVQESDHVDQFWVYSEYVRRVYVDSGVDPSKVKVLPLGTDTSLFSSKRSPCELPTKKRFKFLFVGGTIPRKGPDVLLAAYGNAFSAADDVTLVIKDFGGKSVYAGQTFEAEIKAFRERPNSPEIVYLDESLSDEELASLYVSCDCLVHPYRGEGFALPVLEAMASGLPVVVTRGGSADDFTPEDCSYGIEAVRRSLGREVGGMPLTRAGWWLEPSVESLSSTLRHIVIHPDEASKRGRKAEAFVRDGWSWDHAAERAVALAAELIKGRVPTGTKRVSVRRRTQELISLPMCARKGDLSGARALFGRNRFGAAWNAACKELSERPFHPEAYLLLGEIALKAGDGQKASACSKLLSSMVPNWSGAKQFARKLNKRKGRQRQREDLGAVPMPSEEQRISVCLIVKNEAQYLGQCLESVKSFAFEMVVLDTGSTDETVEIAERCGARVYRSEWADDFSKARNEALNHVSGDWILILDADEIVSPEGVRHLWREVGDRRAIGYRLPLRNEGSDEQGQAYVPRLFRNAPGLFYIGRIHEQVFTSIEVRRRQWNLENRLGETQIVHFGYTAEMTSDRDKVARNLRLLRLAVEELPGDSNLLMNLGLELSRSGRESEALGRYREAFDAMIATPERDVVPELRESLLTQFTSALIRNQRFPEARDVFSHQRVSDSAMTASLQFLKGLALMRTGAFEEGVAAFRSCVEIRDKATFSNGYAEAYGPAPFHCEALCLQKLGRHDEAFRVFEKAVESPDVPWLIVKDFAVYLNREEKVLEALTLLHSKLAQFREDLPFWLLGARIALDSDASCEYALDWIGEGIGHVGEHSALMIEYVKALLLNDKTALPEGWGKMIEPACESAASWSVRLVGSMLEGRAVEGIIPVAERELSFEVVRLYRRLLTCNALKVVVQINERFSLIENVAPTAARLMRDAVDEANTLPA